MTPVPVTVLGTGSYLPEQPVDNEHLASLFGREIVWLAEMLGAQRRHVAVNLESRSVRDGESNASMATTAAERAIADAGIDPQSIDLIIMATCTPDYAFPATVLFVQEQLALPRCCALELRAGCGGTAQAFMIARQMIAAGAARHALLIGSDFNSRFVGLVAPGAPPSKDLLVSIAMFGDGAGAVVLGAEGPGEVLDARSWSAGTGRPAAMMMRNPGPLDSASANGNGASEPLFEHDFRAILKYGPSLITSACDWVRDESGHDFGTIDFFVPPQVNGRLTRTVAEQVGVPDAKVMSNFAQVGNTVSASIYVLLDQLRRDGTLGPGDTVLLLPAEATKWIYGAVLIDWGLEKAAS